MYRSLSVLISLLLIFLYLSAAVGVECTNALTKMQEQTSETNTATSRAVKLLDRLKDLKIITNMHYYEHAREDLLASDEAVKGKIEHKAFKKLYEAWSVLIDRVLKQIEKYESFSEDEQKKWKKKIEVLGKFTVSQFVTFVEAEGKIKAEPLYRKQYQILKYMNSVPESVGFKVYSYELEKQIKRFFSISEIIRCKF